MSSCTLQVDTNACRGEGICVKVCPHDVFQVIDGTARALEDRAADCISCGQCIAACPSDAIRHSNLPPELFERREKSSLLYRDFRAFLSSRRSIREFKNRPVERESIAKIVEAASTAPMGMPPHSTEILAIDDPKELAQLRKVTVEEYRRTIRAMKNPVLRQLIRLQVGAETFHEIEGHVMPTAARANEAFEKDGTDRYTFHAPVLLLFHANRWAPSYEESAHIVCTYAMLAALTLGLGSTIIGKIPPVVERSKTLRKRYGIPRQNRVVTSLILGYPKYRYRKTIQRELASVRFLGA